MGIDFISDKIPLVRGVVRDFEGVRTGNLVARVFSYSPYRARETTGRRENLGTRLCAREEKLERSLFQALR